MSGMDFVLYFTMALAALLPIIGGIIRAVAG